MSLTVFFEIALFLISSSVVGFFCKSSGVVALVVRGCAAELASVQEEGRGCSEQVLEGVGNES